MWPFHKSQQHSDAAEASAEVRREKRDAKVAESKASAMSEMAKSFREMSQVFAEQRSQHFAEFTAMMSDDGDDDDAEEIPDTPEGIEQMAMREFLKMLKTQNTAPAPTLSSSRSTTTPPDVGDWGQTTESGVLASLERAAAQLEGMGLLRVQDVDLKKLTAEDVDAVRGILAKIKR